jgi:hypothetical protein
MRYAELGSTGLRVSALGLGAMRLPHAEGDPSAIDRRRAFEMVDEALSLGVNYFDTAYPYHGGRSESFLGEALEGRAREDLVVVTKMPSWKVESGEDFDRFLDEQLRRLRTDSLELYLLHALNARHWERLSGLGVLSWAERKIEDGVIGGLGFSFHDSPDVFGRILGAWDRWAQVLLMYNYIDRDYQAGAEGVREAHGRGVGVAVMEPLRGGLLAGELPPEVGRSLDEADLGHGHVDLALQWLWSQPEVSVVLSGMSSLQQIRENCASASRSRPGLLSGDRMEAVERAGDLLRCRSVSGCTGCRYCMPCPEGVAIPEALEALDTAAIFEDMEAARRQYGLLGGEKDARACVGCGACEEACPQSVEIIDMLKRAKSALG